MTKPKATPKPKPAKPKKVKAKQKPRTLAEGRPSRAKLKPPVCSNKAIRQPLNRNQLTRVRDLSQFHASQAEIGVDIGRDKSTIGEWVKPGGSNFYPEFVAAMEKGRAVGSALIRSKQVELALAGDKTMLIWVGKQVLGQREVRALEVSKVNDELDVLLDSASAELFDGKGKK